MNFHFDQEELDWIDEHADLIEEGNITGVDFRQLKPSSEFKMHLAIAYLNDPKMELYLYFDGMNKTPRLRIYGKLSPHQDYLDEVYRLGLPNHGRTPWTRMSLLMFLVEVIRPMGIQDISIFKDIIVELFGRAKITASDSSLYSEG